MEKFSQENACEGDEIRVRFPSAADCVTHKDYVKLCSTGDVRMSGQFLTADDLGKEVTLYHSGKSVYGNKEVGSYYNSGIFKYVTVIEYIPYKLVSVVPIPVTDPVNSPSHYTTGKIEVIDFIEDKELGYRLGNTIKYIARAEHKGNKLQDLEKARWYLDREISSIKND